MRTRPRTLSIKLDDQELARLHALADADDVPIGRMLRTWIGERWSARYGDAPPPPAKTKFGDTLQPTGKARR